jgi:DNA-binding transcriptional LysR family regulator
MFTLDQLRCVDTVAKTRGFRKAAASMDVDQATLSRSIRKLEAEIGVQVFERNRNSVRLTPRGQRLVDLMAPLLERASSFEEKLKELRDGVADHLRIGVGSSPARAWLSAALNSFSQTNPFCSVAISEMQWWDLTDALRDGLVDLAIGECSEGERQEDVVVEPLPHRSVCFVVHSGHSLAQLKSLTMKEISEFPFVGPRLPARRLTGFPVLSGMGRISDDGRFFIPRIESLEMQTMLDVVLGTNAVCLTLPKFAASLIGSGLLRELPFKPPWLRTHYGIMQLRGRSESKSATAFRRAAIKAEQTFFAQQF